MESYQDDEWARDKIEALLWNPESDSDYKYQSGQLRYKDKLYVGTGGEIREKLIQNIHSSQEGGHSGVQANILRGK